MAYKPPDYSSNIPTIGQAIRGGIRESIQNRAALQEMGLRDKQYGLDEARLGLEKEKLGLVERELGLQEQNARSQMTLREMQQRAINDRIQEARRKQQAIVDLISVPEKERGQEWSDQFLFELGQPEKIIERQWIQQGEKKKDSDLQELSILGNLSSKGDYDSVDSFLQKRVEAARNSNNRGMIQDAVGELETFRSYPDAFMATQQALYDKFIGTGKKERLPASQIQIAREKAHLQNVINRSPEGSPQRIRAQDELNFLREQEKIASPKLTAQEEAQAKTSEAAGKSFITNILDPIISQGKEDTYFLRDLQSLDRASDNLSDDLMDRFFQRYGGSLSEAGSTFQSRVSYMAPRMRPPGSGPSSDFDVQQYLTALPNALQKKGGRTAIIQGLVDLAKFGADRGKLASKLIAQINSGKITPEDAFNEITKFDNKGWLSNSFKNKYIKNTNAPAANKSGNITIEDIYNRY